MNWPGRGQERAPENYEWQRASWDNQPGYAKKLPKPRGEIQLRLYSIAHTIHTVMNGVSTPLHLDW